jgi:hypothetical protein
VTIHAATGKPVPPIMQADSLRDEYGHVARQRCHCGSNFLVYDEKVVFTDGTHAHVLLARCLNTDCGHQTSFPFQLTDRLACAGLGRALCGANTPEDPGRVFQGVPIGAQITIGIISSWLAAKAMSLNPVTLDAFAADAVKHLGLSSGDVAAVVASLNRIGVEFTEVVERVGDWCALPPG